MGAKSRSNFKPGMCLKDCINRDRKTGDSTYCDLCIKFSLLRPPSGKVVSSPRSLSSPL